MKRVLASLAASGAVLVASLLGQAEVTAPAHAVSGTGDPVIAAVGDMACDTSDPGFNAGTGSSSKCAEQRTSDAVLADSSIDQVLGLGDYQYDCGDVADYQASYDPTWGRLDPQMDPVVGNHEYKTGNDVYGHACPTGNSTAANYFTHFGAAAHQATLGHFSTDIGAWHIIALNSNCSKGGGCSATSAQTTWLKSDLASHTNQCTLAYWHHPYFTGGKKGINSSYAAWWNALYAAHADVVLNGHVHNYQRFASLNPSGVADSANGITEYIVGTGGEALVSVAAAALPHPVASAKTFGFLRMTLSSGGWQAAFVNSSGTVLDTSSGTCQ
jgi:hypothetical protein